MPNWNEINRCPVWRVLGVCECNNCNTKKDCWGDEVELRQEENKMTCPYCAIPPHKPPKESLICPVCGRFVKGIDDKEAINALHKQTDSARQD